MPLKGENVNCGHKLTNMNIILLLVIILTVLVSIKGFNDLGFFRNFEFHIGSIRAGEHYRMITSGFLHADPIHLAFNMLTLFYFAPVVLGKTDNFWFLVIYLGSLVFGSFSSLYFHRNEYSYRAIGASGAVMGVLYSAILFEPNNGIGLMFIPFTIPAYLFGIIYLLYSIYGMKTRMGNIGHSAHVGGAVGGFLITLAKAPNLVVDDPKTVIILLVPIVILFIMERTGKL